MNDKTEKGAKWWVRYVIVPIVVACISGGVIYTVITPSEEPVQPKEEEKPPTAPSMHCTKPTTPVLVYPGHNEVQPNHYYGQGEPWRFDWLDSSCEGGTIKGYRIVVKAVGATVPAIDTFVEQSEYTGDTSGTIGARKWAWKVQAVDDWNQLSDWSEERSFYVPPWQE